MSRNEVSIENLIHEGRDLAKQFVYNIEMKFSNVDLRLLSEYRIWVNNILEFAKEKNVSLPYALFELKDLELNFSLNNDENTYHNSISIHTIDVGPDPRLIEYMKLIDVQIQFLETQKFKHIDDEFYKLFLSKEGKLIRNFREAREEYSIERGSLRYNLIKYLKTEGSYQNTNSLAKEFKTTSRLIRKTIGDLRRQIEKNFSNISGNDFILSKKGQGYKLNPKYKILDSR